jgi:hypothetical protein
VSAVSGEKVVVSTAVKRAAITIKDALRDAKVLMAVQKVTAGRLKRSPIEQVPGWLGKLHEINVPVSALKERSLACAANICNILELLKTAKTIAGDFAECGVCRGGTLLPMSLYLAQNPD